MWIKVAGISGFLAVAFGAFGGHLLKNKLSADMMDVYQTAVKYHFIHTLALLALALFAYIKPFNIQWGGILFSSGILIFCGSLYALSLTGIKMFGVITPVGGLLLMAGWLWVVFAMFK